MQLAKKIMTACAIAALTVGMSACSAENKDATKPAENVSFEAGTTMDKLSKAGKITVGTKFDQPLFGLKGPSGRPEGFDIEVATIIAAKLGIPADKINFVESVSANREPFIEQGKVDIVVATYTINDKRKEVVNFGGPYYIAGQDFLVAKGNPKNITGVDDLVGQKVCSVTGSTSEKNLKAKGIEVIATDTYSNCLTPLRAGEVVAVSTDNVILAGLVDQSDNEFEVIGNPFTTEPYGIGLKKGDTEFQAFINKTLQESFDDGSWAKAWEKTAGKVLDTPEPPKIATP